MNIHHKNSWIYIATRASDRLNSENERDIFRLAGDGVLSNTGQFRKSQSWTLITVHGQFLSNGFKLYCQITIRPSQYIRKHTSPLILPLLHEQRNTTEMRGAWQFAELCIDFNIHFVIMMFIVYCSHLVTWW